jgi:hypothetical protein
MTGGVWQLSDSSPPPLAYLDFIDDAKRFVASKGMRWETKNAGDDSPHEEMGWDLRILTGSHAKHASRLGDFLVDEPMRGIAVKGGWAVASLPVGKYLSDDVQDFIKALVVHRCRAARSPRDTRHHARVYRTLFSTTSKAPWDLCSEDVNRFEALREHGERSKVAVAAMVRTINENVLSRSCPLVSTIDAQPHFKKLQTSLTERHRGDKLPKLDALYELVRIVFREQPASHSDLIRFSAFRILILTGLRLNEVLMLPADCLRWEEHIDVVTGKPAHQVGGVSRTLRLRYFALKQEDGLPDLLVEDYQWVATRFQDAVVAAVELAVTATASLRSALALQHEGKVVLPDSDLRQFKTSVGASLTTADLLFLQPGSGRRNVPDPVPASFPVTTLSQNSVYLALGLNKAKKAYSFFTKYGSEAACGELSVKPHSLRHLMNTELFRQGVPDTVITQQFGRKSVAQSYEYDHRSLAERLEFVSLPPSTKSFLSPGSAQELVAKMVVGGLVPTSHIARSFAAIQASDGDMVAFRYLAANSDGFHVTPYGFCVNSFSMNPCARHLKCFDQCKHFTASGLPEHRVTLESLREKLVEMRAAAASKPVKAIGRKNQIAHADALLIGVKAALDASPNEPVFRSGVDYSAQIRDVLL